MKVPGGNMCSSMTCCEGHCRECEQAQSTFALYCKYMFKNGRRYSGTKLSANIYFIAEKWSVARPAALNSMLNNRKQ